MSNSKFKTDFVWLRRKKSHLLRCSGFSETRHTTCIASSLKNHCAFLSRWFLAGVYGTFYLAPQGHFLRAPSVILFTRSSCLNDWQLQIRNYNINPCRKRSCYRFFVEKFILGQTCLPRQSFAKPDILRLNFPNLTNLDQNGLIKTACWQYIRYLVAVFRLPVSGWEWTLHNKGYHILWSIQLLYNNRDFCLIRFQQASFSKSKRFSDN